MFHPIIAEDIKDVIDRTPELKRLEGKTVLLSGAGGLLPSYLVYTIVALNEGCFKKPCCLLAIIRRPVEKYKRLRSVKNHKNIKFIVSDISDYKNEALHKIDYIIHAASQATPVKYLKESLNTAKSNSIGLIRLLEIAKKQSVEGFLFFSSGQIYGSPTKADIPTPESYAGKSDPLDIRACYDESKRFGETLSMLYHEEYGIPVKIVRPFQVYGPGLSSSDLRAFSDFSYHAARGEPIILRSSGDALRTFCYLADGTVAFWKVLFNGKPAEAYNVGCEKPLVSIKNLAKIVSKAVFPFVEVKSEISEKNFYLEGSPSITCPDIRKITNLIGEEPRNSLEVGFSRVISWIKDTKVNKS